MSALFQVGDIVTRRGDDLHRILQISSCGDSMLVECIRPDKGVVVDDDGTRSDPCYKIGDQEWNLPRRYSYPEFMTIEGEAAHSQAYGIADTSKTGMLPVSPKPVSEPAKPPVVYKPNGLVRWVADGGSPPYFTAYLGKVVVTEFYVDADDDEITWSPDCLLLEGDHYYTNRTASSLSEAKAQVEDYVAAWMRDAGVVKAGAA